MNNITGGLVRYKPGTAELKPYLAESWEVQDGRKDLKFADGKHGFSCHYPLG